MKGFLVTTRPQEKFKPVLIKTCFEVKNMPLTRVVPRADFDPESLTDYNADVYVVTSSVGAELLMRALPPDSLKSKKLVAIGRKTSETLNRFGVSAEVPHFHNSDGIAEIILRKYSDRKIALVRSSMGTPELNRVLSENRITFRDFQIYDVVRNETNMSILSDSNLIGILLTSRYEAAIILDHAERTGIRLKNLFAIGSTTKKFIESRGYSVSGEVPNSDFEDAIRIIAGIICR
ncbi:MAG: uroporphyrinogen-III synthase [Candidatus Thermoplasmatota archaeon]|nr:uroporphyrinogen-III synthase [Candidatus Thermoplasmatota archaeon]MCL5731154.1 uroporphyrinogen-III synthase [Candidatus Thermoplasmatota archaeon]